MALKIRLRQQGRNNRPFYRLVLADMRTKRDGKYIEALGWYNPFETSEENAVSIKADRIQHWIDHGALVSESAEALLSKAAPHVIKFKREKELAKRVKAAEQRRNARKA
jgi:small subunit ribosomal protein S16